MRITFILPPPGLSGGIRVIAIYAERLARRGHRVTLVYPPNPQPSLRRCLSSVLHGDGWPKVPRIHPSHIDSIDVEKKVLETYRPVEERDVPDADVVVATWWETAEWVAGLTPRKGKPVYFLQHYEIHDGQPADRVRNTWHLPMRKICVAEWLADIARDEFGDSSACVVPNSVDIDQFHAPDRDKQSTPTVGYMYSTAPWKGCDVAGEAVTRARQSLPNLRTITFGMMQPGKEIPLPENAEHHVLPEQTKIRELYAGCDAWLFASRSEGFGLPILEAMACRTPVIAVPVGAAPELVGKGGGILVNADDPDPMAAAIVRVATMTSDEWKEMSNVAYSTATGYTWDDATGRFEEALEAAMVER